MRKLFYLIILLVAHNSAHAQLEYHKWYFGNQAGIDFTTTPPTALTNSGMTALDNPASIADYNGNILFYCNGTTVYNKNHVIMANGTGLLGNVSGGHTATICKMPGNNTLYYIFTMATFAGANGLRYSVVDMSLNGGLGGVVVGQKNISILTPAVEQVLVVKHANNTDIWLVAHPWNSASYNCYLITSAGINLTPVVSTVGSTKTGTADNALGQITINKALNKIAAACYWSDYFEIFDFNNATGVLSNPIQITGYSNAWGLEFSASGNKLYLSKWTDQDLYQFDITTYTQAAISASAVLLGNVQGPGAPYFNGYMMLGPDNKIYIAVYLDQYLAVINNPDATGAACNLVDNGFYLGGQTSAAGLPDKIVVTYTCTDSIVIGNDTTICSNENLLIGDSLPGFSYLWNTNDTTAFITVDSQGLYILTSTSGPCVYRDTITITVNPAPIFTLGNDTTICQGQSVTLNPGIAGATYLWSTGAVTQTISVSTAGTYWLSVTQAGCSWVDTINISVLNPPALINLGNDTSVCSGQSVLLSTGVANTIWSTGVSGPQITVNTSGTYAAGVVNACGAVADSVVITILPLPTFTLGNDTTICQGQSITLNPGIAGASYLWSTGAVTQTITVSTAGTFWLSVTQAGCSWVDTINVTVLNPPAPINLGNDTAVCFGQAVTLSTGIASTLWSTGVTATQISVNTAATYWASVTNICGAEADTMVLTVNPAPVFTLGNDTTICQGQSLTLDPGFAGASYLWSTGAVTQTITVSIAGTYWLSVTQAGCSWVDTINVTVLNPPVPFSLGNDTTICQGESVVFNTGISFTVWSTGITDSTISASATGTYWAVISNICGTVSDTVNITVNPLPVFNLGNDTTICQGQSVTLDPGINGAVYTWSTSDVTQAISVSSTGSYSLTVTQSGCAWADTVNVTVLNPPQPFSLGNDTAICAGQTLTLATGISSTVWSTGLTATQIVVSTSGAYIATISNLCGIESDTLVLTVNPLPIVNLGNDTALCTGETFILDATSAGATYQWQDNSINATYTVSQQGTYAVTVTENGCSESDAVTITYQSIPQFLLGDDTTLCVGDALVLSPFTGTNPAWQDGSLGSTFTVFNAGVYSVTVQTACGIASDSIIIDYDYCDCYLTIPTAFSPNNDGLNDKYRPIYRCPIEKFLMRIHNRWGEVVYETNDITEGWDGTYQNTPQPISAFVWYIQYTDPYTDKEVFMSGNVTLLR